MSIRKEKISAFLDNDMHQDELMSFSLSAEAEDANIAQRYQMIGDALRGELSETSFIDVSHAVRQALSGEPGLTAAPAAVAKPSPRHPGGRSAPAVSWNLSSWFNPVAGLAFAVMVALVVVLTVSREDAGSLVPVASNNDSHPAGSYAVADQPVVQSTAVADSRQSSSESIIQKTVVSNAVVSEGTVSNAAAGKKTVDIHPYINQHLEYATQDALQGRLPYVRAVNYEAGK